ncbi:MAG: hypothetical protein JKY89_13840 [Immundisolibacteraceae bacterium]|nr:hypothetical protein [Immundisolibacteraceae bacterium]
MHLKLTYQLARSELRYSRRTFSALFLAIFICVTALTAITSFAERIELAMAERSGELLGGDLRITSQRDLQSFINSLPENLKPDATVLEMPSMAAANEKLQLVELKVVGGQYPLLGKLQIVGQGAKGQPSRESVWVEPSLMTQLNVKVGDKIELGYSQLTIGGVIEREPDRVAGAFSVGPRVIISAEDIVGTRLIQPGSRFRTRLLYKRPATERFALEAALAPLIPSGSHLENASKGLEQTRNLTQQSSRYLRLTAFAGLLLAMVAVFLSVSSLLEQRTLAVATLKAIGAPASLVLQLFLALLVGTALAAGVMGVIAGMTLQNLLPYLLGNLLPSDLPQPGSGPVLQGITVALLMTILAAVPPLWRLVNTAPIRVLRSASPPAGSRWGTVLQIVATIGTTTLLLIWLAQDFLLGLQASAALLLLMALFALMGQFALALLLRTTRFGGFIWRQAISGLVRRRTHSLFAIAALATGVLALLAPTLVQQDLMRQWLVKVPADSPNHFVIGIQSDQVAAVNKLLAELGASQFSPQPMIRARLVSVDDTPVSQLDLTSRRAKRMAERENNLSWRLTPEPHNPVLQGQWWTTIPARQEISVEKDWAELLGANIGSELVFTIGGSQHRGTVTSIRQVDWERMTTNFFVIFSPGALADAPTSYVTALHIKSKNSDSFQQKLVSQFPNLTVIDMRQMVAAMQAIIARLASAVQFMGALTLLAGCSVLVAVVVSERGQVEQEAALLRALGAAERQIRSIFTLRFSLLGLLTGLLGVSAAVGTGALLTSQLLKTAYHPSAALLAITLLISSLLVTLVGRTGCRQALTSSPLNLLKESR